MGKFIKGIDRKDYLKIGISLLLSCINIFLVESLEIWTGSCGKFGLVIFRIVGFSAFFAVIFIFLRQKDKRLKGYALFLGALLALSYVLGCRLRRDGTALAGISALPEFLLSVFSLAVFLAGCAAPFLCNRKMLSCSLPLCGERLARRVEGDESSPLNHGKSYVNHIAIYSLLILLCWIPVFLAYYPSVFAYDAEGQLYQVIAHDYSTHHPLLHTLFLGMFFRLGGVLGSYSAGMAVHSVAQMLLMAAVFACTLFYLERQKVHIVWRILLLLFYALFPVNSVLAISTTKDVLFSALVLLYVLCLHQMFCCGRESESDGVNLWRRGVPAVVTALLLLFRNNAVYAVLPSIFLVWLVARKRYRLQWKKYFLCTIAALILFAVSFAGLKAATGAKNGSPREMLSVPLQQMARVRVKHEEQLSDKLREELDKYLPSEWVFAAYNPYFADPVKNRAVIHDNPVGMLKTWGKLLPKFPQTYIDAFLDNCIGCWFLEDVSHAEIYGVGTESGFGYLSTDNRTMPAGCEIVEHSYLPALREFMERIVSDNEYQKIPVLRLMFAPAFYWWLFVLYVMAVLYRRQYERLIPAMFLGVYYLTLLLSPAVLVRYMYPFFVSVPVLLSLLFGKSDRKDEN